MSRMEIVAGPGKAARFGEVCVWAGAGASELLVTFLVESARNVGMSSFGGARIAEHIGAVLAGRDPEPGVPFASVGPSQGGTAILLHGAVQAWDGSRWLVPQPQPGWLRTEVAGPAPISVTAHGVGPAYAAPGSDLRGGVVPAAGFSLVPEASPALATSILPTADPGLVETVPNSGGAGPGPSSGSGGESTVVDATELVDALRHIRQDRTENLPSTATVASAPPPPAASPPTAAPPPASPASPPTSSPPPTPPPDSRFAPDAPHHQPPPGILDLASEGMSPLPPLPPVGQPDGPVPGQPVVAGVLCPAAHFNHPAVRACVVCRRPVTAESGRVSGSRPSLGVLVIDDGAVFRLERSYLIGSDPGPDPTVTGGRVRPLTLESAPGVAAAHAEIRLTGWGVSAIDRGSDGVTQVLLPGETTWTTLRPFIAYNLRPGAHIAVGPRVVSLISPWPIDEPIT